MTKEIAIGIDIGGTNTTFGFVDKDANIISQFSIRTTDYETIESFVAALSEVIFSFTNSNTDIIIKGIGIGVPNGNYYNGSIEFAPNLKWKGVIPLAEMINKKMHVPVLLTNDANAAALGEMIYGGAVNMKDFIFITLGTGLGSGIVVNGEMVYGNDGFAGEIGHVIIVPNGRMCGCGRKGCVETYCSATGIKRTFIELLEKNNIESEIVKSNIDAKYIYDQAIAGNKYALEAFEITGDYLGLTLANSAAYTSPEAIFLFGGLANAGEYIFKPTIRSFEKNLLKIYQNKIKILPSKLKESDAAVLGAASLIWKELNN
jgi:glucokinase